MGEGLKVEEIERGRRDGGGVDSVWRVRVGRAGRRWEEARRVVGEGKGWGVRRERGGEEGWSEVWQREESGVGGKVRIGWLGEEGVGSTVKGEERGLARGG